MSTNELSTSVSTHGNAPADTKPERGISNSPIAIALALMLATATFFSGLHLGSTEASVNAPEATTRDSASLFSAFFGGNDATPDSEAELDEFWRVWNLLEEKFVTASASESVSREDRIHGAIQGLVSSYDDPYTVFLPPVESAQFEEDISGEFSGVGMEVGMRDGLITVIAPLPETPAKEAGVLSGDVIVEIDGESTENMTIDAAVKRIRGEKGTEVVLTVYRQGASELQDISIIRDTIDIPTVRTELQGDTLIVSLYNFNALSEMKMQEAIREFSRSGAEKMVLDLRGNPGGFMHSAVAIASYFLPAGKVVLRENFGDAAEEQVFRSQGRVVHAFTPETLVVLIDGGSASASEILAGALSQHGVATLIGQQTFGKGSVQELVELPDGSSLKVTVARWLTPDGTSISEGGLAPDVVVPRSPEQFLNDEDPQREAALAWLAGERDLTQYTGTSTIESLAD